MSSITPQNINQRPDLKNRTIFFLVIATAILIAAFYSLRHLLPKGWSIPGSSELYLVGVAGSIMILVPFLFSLGKRLGFLASPPVWFVAHVLCGFGGIGLLFIHSGGSLTQSPAILLACVTFLVLQGSWARIRVSKTMSSIFGSKYQAFIQDLNIDRTALAELIMRKVKLLRTLDVSADEALFSPNLRHWIKSPRNTFIYLRLAQEEQHIVNAHANIKPTQKYWRTMHILVAYLFLLGLFTHIVIVTFFARNVAGDEPIHWWYLSERLF